MVKAFGVEVVRTTLEVALTCERCGKFRWIAKSGKLRSMMLPDGWLTVNEAAQLPVPNTFWMKEPWSRADFTGWLSDAPMDGEILSL